MLLERIVRLVLLRFWTEGKVVLHHRPHAGNVTMSKQNLTIISSEDLISEIDQSRRDVDPHKGQVPLKSASQPPSDGKCLGPVQKIFLWNLCAKAGERPKNLQAATHHHEKRNCIHPMAEANHQRMLVGGVAGDCRFIPLRPDDLDNSSTHGFDLRFTVLMASPSG